MNIEQIAVAIIFITTLAALIGTKKRPAGIFAASALSLVLLQQVTIDDLLDNATNKGLVTLILLLIVSQCLDKTTLLKRLGRSILVRSFKQSYLRLFSLTFFSSAILNNTAVVASLIGSVKQNQFHPSSKLLIPLSYAAILGGTVTLIGTSTNLIVDSFLIEKGHPGFAFFDFTIFGLTAGLICGVLIFFCLPLLPSFCSDKIEYQSYLLEADVEAGSELIGKTVEENHLRNLPEMFLMEVIRGKQLFSPVSPDLVIQESDKLIFNGNAKNLDTLEHINGLTTFAQADGVLRDNLTEVIISNRAPVIGKTIKQLGFRALFDAAVVAIRRDGEEIRGKLGELKLQAGDFLLLATGNDFQARENINKNFFVVSEQQIQRKLLPWQEFFTWAGFLTAITLSATGFISLATGLLFFSASLVVAKISSIAEIKRNIPLNLIIIIVGALTLANGLESSGLLGVLTESLQPYLGSANPLIALICVYLLTVLLTEFVTNNAAAALMFPFAYGLVQTTGMPLMPFALAVAFAASASFISPYGYQTNTIVFSASNYKFSHFSKIGLPISIAFSSIVIALLHWVYF